jgi:hypothetical protein
METTDWTCDACGEQIEGVDAGWIEWINLRRSDEPPTARDLRLVHHLRASPRKVRPGCQFDQRVEHERDGGIVADLPLQRFLGGDGLMTLLRLLQEARLPSSEVIEMIKRVHIPGYEAARRHFDAAWAAGVIERDPQRCYRQGQIEAVIEFSRHPATG